MKRQIEVELKFQVLNPEKLKEIFGVLPDQKQNTDVYLDNKEGDLFKRGIFVRVRDGKKLDFKFNMEDGKVGTYDHTHCDEYSFELPLRLEDKEKFQEVCEILEMKPFENSLEDFKQNNSLSDLVIVDKKRCSFSKNGFIITVDELTGVGNYLEIEKDVEIEALSAEEEKRMLDDIKKDINDYVVSLGLDLKEIKIGYCEIALRQKNFELYKMGQYVMEEDR